MGLASGLNFLKALEFALKITAVFLILPKIVTFMQSGFSEMAAAMQVFVKKRFKGNREINVGINHMVFVDNDAVIISSVILMPITIALAILLRFIYIFPLADLSTIVLLIVVVNAVSRGRILRNVIIGIPVIIISLYTSSFMASTFKMIADRTGYNAGVGDSLWNSSLNGNSYLTIWVSYIFEGNLYAIMFLPVLGFLMFLAWRYYKKSRNTLM